MSFGGGWKWVGRPSGIVWCVAHLDKSAHLVGPVGAQAVPQLAARRNWAHLGDWAHLTRWSRIRNCSERLVALLGPPWPPPKCREMARFLGRFFATRHTSILRPLGAWSLCEACQDQSVQLWRLSPGDLTLDDYLKGFVLLLFGALNDGITSFLQHNSWTNLCASPIPCTTSLFAACKRHRTETTMPSWGVSKALPWFVFTDEAEDPETEKGVYTCSLPHCFGWKEDRSIQVP